MEQKPATSRRFPIGLAIAVAAVVGLVVTASLLAGARPRSLDRSTPEGVVQAYLLAVVDEDWDEALRWLADTGGCSAHNADEVYLGDDVRITIGEVKVTATWATVEAEVRSVYGTPPFMSEYTSEESFSLRRVAGAWKIAEVPWGFDPWAFPGCS